MTRRELLIKPNTWVKDEENTLIKNGATKLNEFRGLGRLCFERVNFKCKQNTAHVWNVSAVITTVTFRSSTPIL